MIDHAAGLLGQRQRWRSLLPTAWWLPTASWRVQSASQAVAAPAPAVSGLQQRQTDIGRL